MADVKIVVPGDDPVQIQGSPHLDRLDGIAEVIMHTDRPTDTAEKVARVQGARVIMNTRGAVTWGEDEFSELPDLEFITSCSIGTDMFDLEAARRHNVIISNQPGRTAPVVAEHMLALMFAVARRTSFFTAEMKAGRWPRMDMTMLQGKTLGILGTGAIGGEMARLGNAIGMNVIAWTYNPTSERAAALGVTFKSLEEVLAESDAISIHVKLTDESRGLIGADQIAQMKPGSMILNGARGPIVDTVALADALNSGHLGGAGIDVFDDEPTPPDHPLFSCDHVVLTPHCADMTPEGVDLLNGGAVDNAIAFLEGRPQNIVT